MKTVEGAEGVGNKRMGYLIRPMRLEDVAQVAHVEQECFPTGWTPTPFKRELQNRQARYIVACEAEAPWQVEEEAQAVVPADPAPRTTLLRRLASDIKAWFAPERLPPSGPSQHVAGYLGLWFITDEAHVTSIGVREIERRRGVGEILLLASIEVGIQKGSRAVTLETRVSNYPAQSLYTKYGFNRMGIRKGYYTDNREDALIMTTDNLSSPGYRELLERLRREHAQRWGESVRLLA